MRRHDCNCCWLDGLNAYTVATTSRAKALAVWCFHRDLFRDGEATEITSGPDYEAAKARLGETIRRTLGAHPSKPTSRKLARAVTRRRAVERARLERLEESIAELAEEKRAGDAEIAREREALKAKEARLEERLQTRRETLERKRSETRARLGKDQAGQA